LTIIFRLRTYIELRVENERLKSKVDELRSIVASQPALPEPPSSTVNSMYATSMMGPPMIPPASVDPPNSYYIASNLSTSTFGDTKGIKDYSADGFHDSASIPTSSTDDDVGDGAKKKRVNPTPYFTLTMKLTTTNSSRKAMGQNNMSASHVDALIRLNGARYGIRFVFFLLFC
jgi:hypothetical protein